MRFGAHLFGATLFLSVVLAGAMVAVVFAFPPENKYAEPPSELEERGLPYTIPDHPALSFKNQVPSELKVAISDATAEGLWLMPKHFHEILAGTPVLVQEQEDCGLACYVHSRDAIVIAPRQTLVLRGERLALEHLDWLYIYLHESGHAVGDANVRELYEKFKATTAGHREVGPTKYSQSHWEEDFAESFAFYVLRPDYLLKCCPERYAFFQAEFGRAYTPRYPIAKLVCLGRNWGIEQWPLPEECRP